jgi:predicted dehydrogenase
MTYRTAIVGARRGLHHADAYLGLEDEMRVVAICERDEALRAEAGKKLDVPTYADFEEMLQREQLDIVHAVTMPTIPRARWVRPAAKCGVKVLVIEKPIALRPNELRELVASAAETRLNIAVNHQRRYMPFADKLLELAADPLNGLGDAHFIRASTYGKVMDMSTHLLDLVLLGLGEALPTHVWAAAQGWEDQPIYPGPKQLMATFTFEGGARALFEASPADEHPFGEQNFPFDHPSDMPAYGPHRLSLDIWATRGRFWWREWGTWGYQLGNGREVHWPTAFSVDDLPAQRGFTRALGHWIEGSPHRCRLETALLGYDMLQGALRSALCGKRLAYPDAATLSDTESETLMQRLQRNELEGD